MHVYCPLRPKSTRVLPPIPTPTALPSWGLGQIFHPQTIVVLAPLATAQRGLRGFLERQIGEGIGLYAKGPAANEE